MSVSAISSASLPAIPAEIQKPTAAQVASSQSPAQLPTDTVSLSSAAMKATGGDADHDGDSH